MSFAVRNVVMAEYHIVRREFEGSPFYSEVPYGSNSSTSTGGESSRMPSSRTTAREERTPKAGGGKHANVSHMNDRSMEFSREG